MPDDPLPIVKLAHDLRQPLRAILTTAQIAAESNPAPELAQALEEIVREARRQDRLLTAAVEYETAATPASSGSVLVSLSLSLATACRSLETFRLAQGGTIRLPDPLPACHVPAGAVKVLEKLLHNSLKFHAAGARPQVDVHAEVLPEDVVLRISDNGLGIEAKYRERVFLPFTRLHNVAEYEGTGLQLAIARRLAEALGGTLKVAAEDSPSGVTLELRLPRGAPAA